jgi:hypothetical protein
MNSDEPMRYFLKITTRETMVVSAAGITRLLVITESDSRFHDCENVQPLNFRFDDIQVDLVVSNAATWA